MLGPFFFKLDTSARPPLTQREKLKEFCILEIKKQSPQKKTVRYRKRDTESEDRRPTFEC